MSKSDVAAGTVHELPIDLEQALRASPGAVSVWQGLTPLARNEWICWTITPKQPKTRASHVARTITELQEGMRRPCCWIGCIHRTDKPISSSIKWLLSHRTK